MLKPSALTRSSLQQLAESRLHEAKSLMRDGLYDGAVYLAGYSLELALKARICRLLDSDYPLEGPFISFKTHSYNTLLRLAGLEKALKAQRLRDPDFDKYWYFLVGSNGPDGTEGWSESWRYRNLGTANEANVLSFIRALEDPTSGILTWLKTLW